MAREYSKDQIEHFEKKWNVISESYYNKRHHTKGDFLGRLTEYQLHNAENDIIHNSYDYERDLMNAISEGNYDMYLKITSTLSVYSIGHLADSFSKNLEYQIVSGISLYTRAAIEGGVSPSLAYDLSDVLLQQVAACETADDYSHLIEHAAKVYINAVNTFKSEKPKSTYVEDAKEYIIRHLNMKYCVDDIANQIGIDKAYLMRLFKKYEGVTISTYIHLEKIRAGKNMLTFSDYTIEEIAHYLQFSSQSHFGAIFKKFTGMSPGKYRQSL